MKVAKMRNLSSHHMALFTFCASILFMPIRVVTPASTTFNPSSVIVWQDCPSLYQPGFQCPEFRVPLDWNNPQGPSISLHMITVPTTNPKKRIGALFINPGGPGSSTLDFVSAFGPKSASTLLHATWIPICRVVSEKHSCHVS